LETQARALEHIIKFPKGKAKADRNNDRSQTSVTWDNPAELEAYIAKLQVYPLAFCSFFLAFFRLSSSSNLRLWFQHLKICCVAVGCSRATDHRE
jgi:hypothetical protein